jgi:UDP-glucose 4-epimerase
VDESVQKPASYYRNNLIGLLSIAEVCGKLNIPLVFSSSCSVYGNPERLPVSEDETVKKAESPYANTKKMGEEILRDMAAANEIRTLCLRYFNPIGAHSTAIIGEFQDGVPHHLVPYIVETASGKRKELNVFGSDWDTRDGTCIRDYIHVVDIAEAHIAALELLHNAPEMRFDVINLGSGNGQTVLEMVQAFEKSTGMKVPVRMAPRRPGDVEAVYANNEKAKRMLNWTPKRSLEEMLASAWNFEQTLKENT